MTKFILVTAAILSLITLTIVLGINSTVASQGFRLSKREVSSTVDCYVLQTEKYEPLGISCVKTR